MSELDQSQTQSAIYLAVLLTFLLSSLFFRRAMKISQILKYLFAWGAIALVGVALYAYRFEFSDFKNRMMAEINPSAARVDKSGRIVLNISQDGHFYLDAKVNGEPIRFLIDTGASDIVLNLKDAQKIGIDVGNLNYNKRYETANGAIFGASVVIKEFDVSDVEFRDLRASVNSADLGTSLLGMSFLRGFSRYEFYRDKLILEM